MNKRILTPVLIAGLVAISLFGVKKISAQGALGNYQTLVQKIAQKFGLNESDVQSVFDEVQKDQQIEMRTKYEDKLTQDVKNGKITEAQKQLILAKHKELQDKRLADKTDWKNLTPDQRKAKMDQEKTDLENWAKQNGIDVNYVWGGRRMMSGKGMMRQK